MFRRLGRLFVIKTRWEALAVIYALALGAVDRGHHYVDRYPGIGGWLLFAACTGVVFMAGARLLDVTRKDSGERRRRSDVLSPVAAMSVPLAIESTAAAGKPVFFRQDEVRHDAAPLHGPVDARIEERGVRAAGNR